VENGDRDAVDAILFRSDSIRVCGADGFGNGSGSGHILRAGCPGARNSIKLNLHIVSWLDPFASIFS
jgi:hypothetical protein